MPEFLTNLLSFDIMKMISPEMMKILPTFPREIWETLYCTLLSTVFAYVLGLPLGILLVVGEEGGVLPLPSFVMKVLNFIVNTVRSIPFLIFMVMLLPLSLWLVGTRVGTIAALPPLIIAAAPFVARMVETSLREVDKGVIEAAQAMGCSPWQIITKVLLPESMPSLTSGATIALTTILGYGAMAGAIGGGGLGKVAMNKGYHQNYPDIMLLAVVLLVILVQIFQSVGTRLSVRCDKRLTRNKKGRK